MNDVLAKLGWLARRRDKEAELREELQFHLDEEAAERRAEGLDGRTRPDGRRCRELGNLTLVQEDTRAMWGWTIVEQFGQDVRYAFRTMAANRLFTRAGGPVARAGHRRQHGDLQLHGLDPAALAAGARSRVARRPELAREGGDVPVMREHERQHLGRFEVGNDGRHLPVPGVRTVPQEGLRVLFRVRALPVSGRREA